MNWSQSTLIVIQHIWPYLIEIVSLNLIKPELLLFQLIYKSMQWFQVDSNNTIKLFFKGNNAILKNH